MGLRARLRWLSEDAEIELSQENRHLVHLAVFAGIYVLLLSFFTPGLLLSTSTPTGGDIAAHIYTPWYLRQHLLPEGLLSGWSQAWFAGFPILHFYFPLVSVFQALLSYLIPYEIAFKLGTILGTFFFPVSVYLLFRLLRLSFPSSIVAALLSIGFLFMDSFNIAGGNIPSSLVGEYSYALSLGLCLVFYGAAYRCAVDSEPRLIGTALLLAGAALSHLVPVMIVVAFTPVLLLWAIRAVGVRKAAVRFGVVYGLAFVLTAFWSIPFVARLPYTANMNWIPVEGWSRLLARELWIYLPGAAGGLLVALLRRDRRVLVLAGPGLLALPIYFFMPAGHILNERFMPFWFVSVVLCCAYFVGAVLPAAARHLSARRSGVVVVAGVAVLLILQTGWVVHDRANSYIDDWTRGNYLGFEGQADYPTFRRLMRVVDGLPPGRILWEASPRLQKYGSDVALMALPYFADHPSMEGIYFESSITTPFHFMIAHELSKRPSSPIAGLPYESFDLRRGIADMELYDVSYYLTVSRRARKEALASRRLEHVRDVGEFSIFEVGSSGPVVVPRYEPVILAGGDWLEANLEWLLDPDARAVPLVRDGRAQWETVQSLSDGLPREPVAAGGSSIPARVHDDEIVFRTDAIGQPHWIKTSYFPNWRAEGAEGPYLASPSLMVVVPTQSTVRLSYERTWAEWSGLSLSSAALLLLVIPRTRRLLACAGRGDHGESRTPGASLSS